ncbi:MAG TPA: GNAT family N-acetyltransferase [Acidobacteriota bacterium]|nr:GNAT family N-acetyltransferase [Acidobacteriota bacterium]HNJ39846.1 GNAT family N-acetyltransferase [Acidobacteriota bacterium]
MIIRQALASDANKLTAIAHAAKRYWNYPEHWLAAWESSLTITPEFIARHPIFVADEDHQILGFYALTRDESDWFLEHCWVRPESIGTGIGRQLFEHAIEMACAAGMTSLLIDADPFAAPFYERMGARQIGTIPAPVPEQPDRTLPRMQFKVV